MNKKSVKKALLLVLCAILLVVASVMGTLAYLTDSKTITNTYTVGNVTIELKESEVDEYGNVGDPVVKTDQGNAYLLVPGRTYVKDPVLTVKQNSEDCWVFVKIENNIEGIEATSSTINSQMTAKSWNLLDGTSNVYYKEHAKNTTGDVNYDMFVNFTIKAEWDGKTGSYSGGDAIVLKGYAIQKEQLTTAKEAWIALGNPDPTQP